MGRGAYRGRQGIPKEIVSMGDSLNWLTANQYGVIAENCQTEGRASLLQVPTILMKKKEEKRYDGVMQYSMLTPCIANFLVFSDYCVSQGESLGDFLLTPMCAIEREI